MSLFLALLAGGAVLAGCFFLNKKAIDGRR